MGIESWSAAGQGNRFLDELNRVDQREGTLQFWTVEGLIFDG